MITETKLLYYYLDYC